MRLKIPPALFAGGFKFSKEAFRGSTGIRTLQRPYYSQPHLLTTSA